MRLLAALRIFTEGEGGDAGVYRLTPVSLLLVHNAEANGGACLSQFATSATALSNLSAYLRLDEWFKQSGEDGGGASSAETPFVMAYGTDYWAADARDAERSARFSELMGSDSRLVAEVVVRECGEVFEGVASLVDVGGGNGTMARAIAGAFPHVRCSVLELPHVVEGVPPGRRRRRGVRRRRHDGFHPAGRCCAPQGTCCDDLIIYINLIEINFMRSKLGWPQNVLHDWSDEGCVRILRRCREAISASGPEGKVVIIDMVVGGSPSSEEAFEAQLLMDMCMMVLSTGKERGEETWSKIFTHAGFTRYKIRPVLGARSVLEVYP
jgi:trans-resveratrol di-O-methyltransferase